MRLTKTERRLIERAAQSPRGLVSAVKESRPGTRRPRKGVRDFDAAYSLVDKGLADLVSEDRDQERRARTATTVYHEVTIRVPGARSLLSESMRENPMISQDQWENLNLDLLDAATEIARIMRVPVRRVGVRASFADRVTSYIAYVEGTDVESEPEQTPLDAVDSLADALTLT